MRIKEVTLEINPVINRKYYLPVFPDSDIREPNERASNLLFDCTPPGPSAQDICSSAKGNQ